LRASGKPVICSMGNVAASGGYMLAAACDSVFAQPTTITGSIGVIAGKVCIGGMLEKYGAHPETLAQVGKNAKAFSMLSEFTPEQAEQLDRSVHDMYEDFLGKVMAWRGLSYERVLTAAK
ncbi:unnamed protein product, partial [Phaeothamnion confervicola]